MTTGISQQHQRLLMWTGVAVGLVGLLGVIASTVLGIKLGIEGSALLIFALILATVLLRPQWALLIFVIGLPLHNLMMAFLFEETQSQMFIKLAQPWKEMTLGVAMARLVIPPLYQAIRTRVWPRFAPLDIVLALFFVICGVSVLISHTVPLTGRLLGFRQLVLPMSVYILGRLAPPTRNLLRALVAFLGVDVLIYAIVSVGERLLWGDGLFVTLNFGKYSLIFLQQKTYLPFNFPYTFYTGTPYWLPRAGSLAVNPLDFVTLLEIALPTVLATLALTRHRLTRWQTYALSLAAFMGGVGVFLAYGRTGLLMLPVELVLLLWWGGWRRAWMGALLTGLGAALGGAIFEWNAAYVNVGLNSTQHVIRANQGILFGPAGSPAWLVLLVAVVCVVLAMAFVAVFTGGTLGETALTFSGADRIMPGDRADASIRMQLNTPYTMDGRMVSASGLGRTNASQLEQMLAQNRDSNDFSSTYMAAIRGFAYRTRYYLVISLAVITVLGGGFAAYKAYKLTQVAHQNHTTSTTNTGPTVNVTPPTGVVIPDSTSSTKGHLSSYEKLPGFILKHPLGYGIGSSGAIGVRNGTGLGAESAYLPVGVELGFFGLLLYLIAFLGALFVTWRAYRARGSSLERAVYLGMTVAWIFMLIDGVVTEVTLNFFVMYLLWWMTGAAITHTRASRITVVPATGELRPVRPLRIAVDMQALHTARTGVLTYMTELLDEFQKSDSPHSVTLLSGPRRLDNSKRLNRMINQGLSFAWLHFWLPVKLGFGNYDLLFSPEYITPMWAPVARVVTYHASSFLRRPQDYNRMWLRMFKWITLPAIHRADAILVPSKYAAEEAIEYAKFEPQRIYVTPLGGAGSLEKMQVDPAVVNATLSSFGVQPYNYLLHVGVLERRKNLVALVEAFALWRRQGGPRSFKLVLVGQPGPRPDLDDSAAIHEAIARNGLESSVVLTGHLSLEERNAFYTHAAAVVIPSVLEGFGIPVLETFAAHVPLICSDATALPEVAGNAALLFNPQNPQELASCFMRLGADPGLRAALVSAGEARLRLFTWERTAQATYVAFDAAVMRAYGPSAELEHPKDSRRVSPPPVLRPQSGLSANDRERAQLAGSLILR